VVTVAVIAIGMFVAGVVLGWSMACICAAASDRVQDDLPSSHVPAELAPQGPVLTQPRP
jgi:hypothetical protein